MSDRKRVVCNTKEASAECAAGALCFVVNPNVGSGGDRMRLLCRSRSGRWIDKWERADRLTNFRWKTLAPGHPLYGHPLIQAEPLPFTADWGNNASGRAAIRRLTASKAGADGE